MKVIIIFLAATIYVSAFSQQVDIGLFQSHQNTLEIRLKTHGNFNGLVSNVAFTVRWDANSTSNLESLVQSTPANAYIPMMKSGEVRESDGYNYQVFAGFGMSPMSTFNEYWNMNEEIVLMTVSFTGNIEDFEIVNDSWTENVRNNGSFYTSLNGENRTGIIYKPSVTVATGVKEVDDFNVKIYPNPTTGSFVLEAGFINAGDYTIELINVAGQTVYKKKLTRFSGNYKAVIELQKMATGSYMLQVQGEEKSLSKEIIKQ